MAGKECDYSPYLLPRLYVEDLESNEYLVPHNSVLRSLKECLVRPCYGKAVYGVLLDEIVDIVAKKTIRSFVVVLPPNYTEALVVPRDAMVEPIPVEGMRTTIVVCEGSKVKVGDTIGYVVTRKYELRHIRSHVKGIVVYIYSSPESKPDRNIVFVAPEEAIHRVGVQY